MTLVGLEHPLLSGKQLMPDTHEAITGPQQEGEKLTSTNQISFA